MGQTERKTRVDDGGRRVGAARGEDAGDMSAGYMVESCASVSRRTKEMSCAGACAGRRGGVPFRVGRSVWWRASGTGWMKLDLFPDCFLEGLERGFDSPRLSTRIRFIRTGACFSIGANDWLHYKSRVGLGRRVVPSPTDSVGIVRWLGCCRDGYWTLEGDL